MLEIPSGRRQQVERRQGLLKREASKLYLQEQQQQVLDHYLDQKALPRFYLLYKRYQNLMLAARHRGEEHRFETKITFVHDVGENVYNCIDCYTVLIV